MTISILGQTLVSGTLLNREHKVFNQKIPEYLNFEAIEKATKSLRVKMARWREDIQYNFVPRESRKQTSERRTSSSESSNSSTSTIAASVSKPPTRRLLPEDSLKCASGDKLVLMIPVSKGNKDYVTFSDVATSHLSFNHQWWLSKRRNQQYLCIDATVATNPLLLKGGVEPDFENMFKTGPGNGIHVRFTSTHERIPLSFRSIWCGQVEVWDWNPRQEPRVNFNHVLADRNALSNSIWLVEHLMKEVDGDAFQMTALMNAVLSHQLRSTQQKLSREKNRTSSKSTLGKRKREDDDADYSAMSDAVHQELIGESTKQLIKRLENDAEVARVSKWKEWTNLKEMPHIDIGVWIADVKTSVPLAWDCTRGFVSARVQRRGDSDRYDEFDFRRFLVLIAMMRSRNSNNLIGLAKMVARAEAADGSTEKSRQLAQFLRISASQTAVRDEDYPKPAPAGMEGSPSASTSSSSKSLKTPTATMDDLEAMRRNRYKNERFLGIDWDNLIFFLSSKKQRDGTSGQMCDGTSRLVHRRRLPAFLKGSLWKYNVDGDTYIQLCDAVGDCFHRTYTVIKGTTLPPVAGEHPEQEVKFDGNSCDWNFISSKALDPQPINVTFIDQQVPRRMGPDGSLAKTSPEKMRSDYTTMTFLKDLWTFCSDSTKLDDAVGAVDTPAHSQLTSLLHPLKMAIKEREKALSMKYEPNIRPQEMQGDHYDALPLSGHDETKIEGSIQVFVEFAVEIGLLDWVNIGGINTLQPGENMAFKEIFLYGDCLTIDHMEYAAPFLFGKISDAGYSGQTAGVIMAAMGQCFYLCGQFHVFMHILGAIFRAAYGGLLQASQALLGWKRITRKTTRCHQAALDLARITHHELKRKAFIDWSTWNECQDLLKQLKTSNTPFDGVISQLEQNFQDWKVARRGDTTRPVGQFCIQYLEVVDILNLYDFGVKHEKAMLNEMLMVEMLPMWQLFGKTRYVHLALRSMETLYHKMVPQQLETSRCDEGVNLGGSGNSVALDDANENYHPHVKAMQAGNSKEAVLKNSRSLPFDIACKHFRDELYRRSKPKKSQSIAPKRLRELHLLARYFQHLDVFNTEASLEGDFWWNGAVHVAILPEIQRQPTSKESEMMATMMNNVQQMPVVHELEVNVEDAQPDNYEATNGTGDGGDNDDEEGELERSAGGAVDVVEDGTIEAAARLLKMKSRMGEMKKYNMHRYATYDWREHAKETMLPNAIEKYHRRKRRRELDTAIFTKSQDLAATKAKRAKKTVDDLKLHSTSNIDSPQWKQDYDAAIGSTASGGSSTFTT